MERNFKIYTVNNLPDPSNPGFDVNGIYWIAKEGNKLEVYIRKEDNSDWVTMGAVDLNGFVRFDVAQNLTEEQQQQARDNIGAVDEATVEEMLEDVPTYNVYTSDGSLPVIPDGGQPIERKMTLAGNALNIGDNLIVKGDTVDLGSWLRVNKTTTPVGGLNYKYASILQGTTPHHLIKWYKNNDSSAAAIAIGERAMENTTFTGANTPGSIFWGYLASASSVITGGNHIIIGREAFIGSTLQANVTSVGAYNGTNTKTYGSWFTSIYGRSTGQFSELEGGNIFGTLSGYTCKGSFLNSFGVQNSQYVNGNRNNSFGTLSLIYVTGSNNNVFGNTSFQNANYSNCNIVGNVVNPTQNGHNIWGDYNSTKADIYGLQTFKGRQPINICFS